MKLHWSPRSPFVRKVMIAAHETGLVDRLTCVRTVVAMTAPNAALLSDNPLSKIPTLVLDDGSALYDSGVICEYLDTLHDGSKLFPADAKARWTALRRHALGSGLLDLLILLARRTWTAAALTAAHRRVRGEIRSCAGCARKRGACAGRDAVRHRPYRHRMRAFVRGFSLLPSRLVRGASAACGVAPVFFTAAIGSCDRSDGRMKTSKAPIPST